MFYLLFIPQIIIDISFTLIAFININSIMYIIAPINIVIIKAIGNLVDNIKYSKIILLIMVIIVLANIGFIILLFFIIIVQTPHIGK